MVPRLSSAARNPATFRPMRRVTSLGGSKAVVSSGRLVSTMPAILAGSTLMKGRPARSEGL